MAGKNGYQSLMYRTRTCSLHDADGAELSRFEWEFGDRRRRWSAGCIYLLSLTLVGCLFPSALQAGPRDGGISTAAETPSPAAASSAEQLSADDYSRRQQATMQMWRLRETSRQAVQDAARHPDPEVAERASWILRQWRRGSLPETPPELARLLQQNDDPSVLEELLEMGQFSAVVVAVEESAGTAQRTLLHQRLAAALTRRFPVYVRRADQEGGLIDLLRLVDLVADSKEMAVCRIQLMQELGVEFDDDSLLPRAAEDWTELLRQETEVVVLGVLGRLPEASERARAYGNHALLRVCQMLQGDWQSIARETSVAAGLAAPDSAERSRLWCQALVAADRAGDDAIEKMAVDDLVSMPVTAGDVSVDMRWKCLASHGFVDEALAILKQMEDAYDDVKRSRSDSASIVAIAASRTDLAFEMLGYPYEDVDSELMTWIAEAIEEQKQDTLEAKTVGTIPRVAPKLNRLLSLMRCLLSVGREQPAWTIARELSDSDVVVGSQRARDSVLITLLTTNRQEWLARLAVRPGESSLPTETERLLIVSLSEMDAKTWEMMLESLSELMPTVAMDRRVSILFDLCRGEIPVEFEEASRFRTFYESLASPPPSGRRALVRRTVPRRLNLQVASFFSRLGQVEIASEVLATLAAQGDIGATFSMAERELDFGRGESAASGFERIWNMVSATSSSTHSSTAIRYLRQNPVQLNYAVKATVGQWNLARRQGDSQLAEQLERQIRLLLCSPSTELRSVLLEYLGERGERSIALEGYRTLLPMTAFGSAGTTELYDVARHYAAIVRESDPIEAARWFDLAVGGTLETTYFRAVAYISLPVYVRRWLLEGAIENGDAEQVQRHLDRIERLDPLDIDVAERLIPKMREKGMEAIADAAFNRVWASGRAYVADYPFDATKTNNLAWVAAMNKRELEGAAALAEQAVYFEPDSAIYRDTLAEILFLSDRVPEALQIETGCLLDDPGQWHLHEQIEKYSEAMR